MLFKTNSVTKDQGSQARITAEGIVEAYNLIGYDAVGVSSRDLAAGLDFLLKLRGSAQFAWLSANIINKTSGKPLFKPFLSRKTGDIKIGIVGLTDQLPNNSKLLDKDTEIKTWREILPDLMKELTRDQDFIILLTSLSEDQCREIAKVYPAIKLIVQAKSANAGQLPIKLTESTTLVRTGNKGKYVGMLNITWHKGSEWQTEKHDIMARTKEEKYRLAQQLKLLKDRPERQEYYYTLQKRLETIESSIETIKQEIKSSGESALPPSSLQNSFFAMEISLPDHLAVRDIVVKTKRLINSLNKKAAVNGKGKIPADKGFIGWEKCRNCHREQVKKWLGTKHASSFLTLVKKKQQYNLECLPCHVTGVDTNNPTAALNMPADLQAVGCESCHGAGGRHSANPTSDQTTPVTEKICLKCHVPEHDESFNFARDSKKLNCIP